MREFLPFRLDSEKKCLWRGGNHGAAERHRSLGRSTVLALADSLVDHERLRETFLAAPPVRAIIRAPAPESET